jgi:hypothetical protein
MAKRSAFGILKQWKPGRPKRTSIGKSKNSRPLNKHKKKSWKKYRGQGK